MLDAPVVPVGICKVMAEPVCGNSITGDPILLCNVVNIDKNFRIEESTPISIDGGVPGETCFYYEPPNKDLPSEIVIDTCTGFNPLWEQMTGRFGYTRFNPAAPEETAPDQTSVDNIGILLTELKSSEESCFCTCSEQGQACTNRIRLTIWRKAFCIGDDGRAHPAGGFWIDHYPALEYTRTAQTISSTNGADAGSRYTFLAYTNPDAPAPIIQQTVVGDLGVETVVDVPLLPGAADVDNGCWFGYTTNICPPGDCGCGSCGSGQGVLPPLAAASGNRVSGDVTPETIAA